MILSQSNTLTEDIAAARVAGFTSDFMYRDGRLLCRTNDRWYQIKDLTLIEYCRHEGMNDPSDSSILFLIETNDSIKGCLTSAYGKDADTDLIDFVMSLEKKEK
ncbi:hypothetical protein [Dokdonia sp. 4H-3-7-5]|jgi:hypothetical protein|uniref:hypothetical protein n=1 Tax=Dokdonia sp. (strain 4H-3-7-5) TaxID=983548 RepID=UPI00020A69DD|nr:hypothetical protein [Dokdonia sp. 4H-3-7-5]AEE19001.1 hypothetical protein Krodi_1017 [Dokdonia sp. 4H-3-7-5]